MAYSFDLDKVNFNMLKESGEYDKDFIEALEQKNFEYLERTDIKALCEKEKFVKPLLYLCINLGDVEMYKIYTHLEDKVKYELLNDYNLTCNILQTAPSVIKGTPIAKDEKAILNNINNRPEIVKYISNDLMDNPVFVAELAQKEPAVVKELLEFAIQNSDKLDRNTLDTISNIAKNDAEKAAIDLIDEHVKNNEKSGFKDLKEYLDGQSEENPAKARLIHGKINSELDEIAPEIVKKSVKDALLRAISIERTIQENPDYEIEPKDLKNLYSVENLQEEIEKAGLQGEPQVQEMMAQYKDKYIGLAERMIHQREEQGKNLPKSFVERIEKMKQQEKQQANIQDNIQTYNNEIHVATIDIAKDGKVEGRVAMNNVLEPVPEFVNKGIEEHGFPSQTVKINMPEVSKNDIRALNNKAKSDERVAPGM
ncbi:MAG: hypothetical protein E7314_00300 [Clostridiales bacterium]|nr:hypothetical protein [Clostridiales bacterium]